MVKGENLYLTREVDKPWSKLQEWIFQINSSLFIHARTKSPNLVDFKPWGGCGTPPPNFFFEVSKWKFRQMFSSIMLGRPIRKSYWNHFSIPFCNQKRYFQLVDDTSFLYTMEKTQKIAYSPYYRNISQGYYLNLFFLSTEEWSIENTNCN